MAIAQPRLAHDQLRRPRLVTPLPGPRAAAILARDAQALSPSMTRSYPLVVASGAGAWVTDVDGNTFLDFTAGIAVANTGHAHPRVVAAVQAQAAQLLHMSGTDFVYEVAVEVAERLAALAPVGPGPARVFLCNSGTEAIEGALKLARWATGRPHVLAFLGAFHGRTLGALSLTASKTIQRKRFGPLLAGVHHVPFPSASPGGTSTDQTFRRLDELFSSVAAPDSFAAVFVEPIQGEGGYIVPPDDFLPRLRELTQRHGILLVLDEIQSGMGRTGRMFAAEHLDIQADVVTVAKGLASGLPLGAFVARQDIMTWPPGAHGSTFGGNPVACAAALATLDLLEDGLVANAATRGVRLRAGLEALQRRWPELIRDVRGRGLMLALELAEPKQADRLVQAAFERGLLVLGAGKQAVRLSPPLVISASEVAVALDLLEAALDELARSAG